MPSLTIAAAAGLAFIFAAASLAAAQAKLVRARIAPAKKMKSNY